MDHQYSRFSTLEKYVPRVKDDLVTFLKAMPLDIPVLVVGVGSNLLVRDGGIEGVVIRLSGKGFGGIKILDSNKLRVGLVANRSNQ